MMNRQTFSWISYDLTLKGNTGFPNMDENEPLAQRDIVTIKQVSSGRFLVGQYRGDWNVVTSDNTFPSGDDPRWVMTSQSGGIYTFHRLFRAQQENRQLRALYRCT
jgi:hypothetical protein